MIDRSEFTRARSSSAAPFARWVLAAAMLSSAVGSTSCRAEDEPLKNGWQTVDPATFSEWCGDVLASKAQPPEYWRTKPQLDATFYYDMKCAASDNDREIVSRFLAGEFRPYRVFEWVDIGVPPPWDENPLDNTSWDFYRHALRWMTPLVTVWRTDGSKPARDLAVRTLRDWLAKNSTPPGASNYAWYDHAVATRLRFFAWFWEVWRTTDSFDPDFARLLLGSVYQHALYACDPEVYPALSNHGLEMDAALLAAALTFPEFHAAEEWRKLATRRAAEYATHRFSAEGFHLEQSPFYHWYVLDRFSKIGDFLQRNERPIPSELVPPLQRMAAVWPFLLKPDGTLPTIGDTPALDRRRNTFNVDLVGGAEVVRNCVPRFPNPRGDGATFLLSFEAGYAICAARPLDAPLEPIDTPDTYAVFKCNSFRSPHYHHDALSFILYGLGRDWLVDAGQLNYEERTPERQYMRSARAHNVVLVDGADFELRPLVLESWGRSLAGDFVTVRHELETAHHTRTFRFVPPRVIEIEDVVVAVDDQPHTCTQLFHAAPDLTHTTADGVVTLTAESGERCTITQLADRGAWTVIQGQREPTVQGWYSPSYNELRENAALLHTSSKPKQRHVFRTRIELLSR